MSEHYTDEDMLRMAIYSVCDELEKINDTLKKILEKIP